MPRPRKSDADRRDARVSIHWRPGELQRITTAADALGLTLADFLRMSGLERARDVLERAGQLGPLMGRSSAL